ncbi:MAG: hypothetical protein V1773_16245 [bacterium]
MKKMITKYNKSINYLTLLGYLILICFSAFHHHSVIIPVNKINAKNSVVLQIGNNITYQTHEDCQLCYIINSSNPLFQQPLRFNSFAKRIDFVLNDRLIFIFGCSTTVIRLRAPPSLLS